MMSAGVFSAASWLIPLQQWEGTAPVDFSTPIALGFLLFFFALMVGIGLFAGRYQKNEADYYVAGRRSGIFVIALSGFAAIQSGWGLIGVPGTVFAVGAEYLIVLFTPIGFVIAYWLLAKKMRMLGTYKDAVTAPDAMYYRFGEDDGARLLGAISVLLGCMGYLASQYAALGIIGSIILPFDFLGALIISLTVVGVYTVVGGILAAIWSDAIQGAMMALSGPIVFYYILRETNMGLGEMVSTVTTEAPNYFDLALLGGDPLLAVGFPLSGLFIVLTVAGQPQLTTKFYMIRDVSLLKWGALISGFGYLLTMSYWLAAPWIKAAVTTGQFPAPPNPDSAMPIALVQSAPEIVVAFALTAIIAAIMSTSNAFLNMAAAVIQHDVAQEYYGMDLSDAQQVRWGRAVTVIVLLIAFAIAATFPGLIFVLGAAGWALFASVLFPGIALAYNWKSATTEGILWGGSIALVLTLTFAYAGQYFGFSLPMNFLGGQVAGFIGIVVFVGVSLVTSTAEFDDLEDPEVQDIINAGRTRAGVSRVGADVTSDDD